jgi:hypothetical protein
MNSKNIIFVGIIAAALFTMTTAFQSVSAAPITLDINKAKNPGPGFTAEKIGTVSIDATGNKTTISSDLTGAQPKQDKAFEGWLVDAGGSNYKLSLGKYENGHLQFTENMVNPYTYKQFIVTEEPNSDKDPNSADTYAGADLPTPFGQ